MTCRYLIKLRFSKIGAGTTIDCAVIRPARLQILAHQNNLINLSIAGDGDDDARWSCFE